MIHVAVDANCLAWGWGGIPKVVDRIVRELVRIDGVRVDLLANTSEPFADIDGAGQVFRRVKGTGLWRETVVARWVGMHRPSVFWAPEGVLPRRLRGPSVVTVHDLAVLFVPGIKPLRQRLAHRTAVPRSARAATRVVAVSRSTAADAERLLGVAHDRLRVVPNGVDEQFRPCDRDAAREAVRARFGVDRPFVLAVGAIEPRKGLDVLIEIAEAAPARGLEWVVVLAGAPAYRSEALVERGRAAGACHVLGPVEEGDLAPLYRAAEALVAPSLHEGFGLTPLEAMACGTPAVVAGASGGLVEVSGEAALVVEERSADAWIAAVERARSERERLADDGLRHASRYRWPAVAEAMLAVLEEAAAAQSLGR